MAVSSIADPSSHRDAMATAILSASPPVTGTWETTTPETIRPCPVTGPVFSAFGQVDSETAKRGFLVALVHIPSRFGHGSDDLIERDEMGPIAIKGQ